MQTACPWEYMKTAYNVSNIEKNHMILFCLGFFFMQLVQFYALILVYIQKNFNFNLCKISSAVIHMRKKKWGYIMLKYGVIKTQDNIVYSEYKMLRKI